MALDHSELGAATASLHGLGGDAVLAVWESERGQAAAFPQSAGLALPAPLLSLSLTTSWGATRWLHAFRRLTAPAEIDFVSAEGMSVASASGRVNGLTPEALFGGLHPAEQVRALRFVLQSCRAAFGLGGLPAFAQSCRELVAHLSPVLTPATAEVDVTGGLVLCQGALASQFGRVSDVVVIGEGTVRRNGHLPADAAQGGLRLALEIGPADRQLCLVIFGEQSLACRSLDLDQPRQRLLRWLEKAPRSHELREYLAACLSRAAAADPVAGATLREMQLLFPLPKAGVTTVGKPLGAEVELAVSHGAGGLFVSGWLHDPHGLMESLTAVSVTGRRIALSTPLHRFPRPDVAQHYGATNDTAGFVGFVPLTGDSAPSYQHRFELGLRSGEVLHLAASPQPESAAEARNLVLGCVAPAHLSDRALAEIVAPPAAGLHARHLATKAQPEIVDFGLLPERPSVSVVIPLYKVLDFLRFQIAAFAIDPAMAEAELIYVLDSPEQRGQCEHLLRGLHALYGLPFRLAVMSANYGFAAASNAGAALARAPYLLYLNSDVIPDRAGWLASLTAALESNSRLAAVGPKLLFDDDSLQHAGMYFDRDLAGHWYNLHYYKGLPRAFAPAAKPRLVPAVTGACLLVRRALIERLGGFSEDYIIGDYEDSDLCLRLRAAGYQIGYVPAAELYHLERQSIQHHLGYTRGAACSFNRRLHAERWGGLMEDLCGLGQPAKKRRTVAA